MKEHIFDYDPFTKEDLHISEKAKVVVRTDFKEPYYDLWENGDEIIITFELPGVKRKEVRLTANSHSIELKVMRKAENGIYDRKNNVFKLERVYGGFYKYLFMPCRIDPKSVSASYENDYLEVRVLKRKGFAEKTNVGSNRGGGSKNKNS